jgi:hypothetical protein
MDACMIGLQVLEQASVLQDNTLLFIGRERRFNSSQLKVGYLPNSSCVPSPIEWGNKENVDYPECHVGAGQSSAQGEKIGIIMSSAEFSTIRLIAQRTTNPIYLVRCNAGPNATATDDNSSLTLAGRYGTSQSRDEWRIVNRFGRICSEIEDLMSLPCEFVLDRFFQEKSAMVSGNTDSHDSSACTILKSSFFDTAPSRSTTNDSVLMSMTVLGGSPPQDRAMT